MSDTFRCPVCGKESKGAFHVITKEILVHYRLDLSDYEKKICNIDYQRFCAQLICTKRIDSADRDAPPIVNIMERIPFLQNTAAAATSDGERHEAAHSESRKSMKVRRKGFSVNWWSETPNKMKAMVGVQSYRSAMYVSEEMFQGNEEEVLDDYSGDESAGPYVKGSADEFRDLESDGQQDGLGDSDEEDGDVSIQVQGLSLAERRILEADKCGFLTKEGAIMKNWKRRFFVLKDFVLSYYEHANAERPLGKILLPSYSCQKASTDIAANQYYFSISHPGMRKFNIYADSERERQEWINAIIQFGLATGSSQEFSRTLTQSGGEKTRDEWNGSGDEKELAKKRFSSCAKVGTIKYYAQSKDMNGQLGYAVLNGQTLLVYEATDADSALCRISLLGVSVNVDSFDASSFILSTGAKFECSSPQECIAWMNAISKVLVSGTGAKAIRLRDDSASGYMFSGESSKFVKEFVREMKDYLALLDFCIKHLSIGSSKLEKDSARDAQREAEAEREGKMSRKSMILRRAKTLPNVISPDPQPTVSSISPRRSRGKKAPGREGSLIFLNRQLFADEDSADEGEPPAEEESDDRIKAMEVLQEVFQGYEELYDTDCAFFAELWGTGTVGEDPSKSILRHMELMVRKGIFDRMMGNFLAGMLLLDDNVANAELQAFIGTLNIPYALFSVSSPGVSRLNADGPRLGVSGIASDDVSRMTLFDLFCFVARPILEIIVRSQFIENRLAVASAAASDERDTLIASAKVLADLRLGFPYFFDTAEAIYKVSLRIHSLNFPETLPPDEYQKLIRNFGFSVRVVHEGEMLLTAKGSEKTKLQSLKGAKAANSARSVSADNLYYWILLSHALVCTRMISTTSKSSVDVSGSTAATGAGITLSDTFFGDSGIPLSKVSISRNVPKRLTVMFVLPLDSVVVHDVPSHASSRNLYEFSLIPDDAAGEVLLVATRSLEEKNKWISALLSIPTLAQRFRSEETCRKTFKRKFPERYSVKLDEENIIPNFKSDDAVARTNIVNEIFDTEKKFVEDMKLLIDVFYHPLKGLGSITPEIHGQIFNNVLEIYDCSCKILVALAKVRKESKGDVEAELCGMATAFFNNINNMRGYTNYCAKQEASTLLVSRLLRDDEDVRNYLEKLRAENAEVAGMGILDFLIKPMQRVTKYPLLFKEVLKHTPATHPAREDSVETLKLLSILALSINEYMREMSDLQQLTSISSSVEGIPHALSMVKKGRYLVKEGLHKTWSQKAGGKVQERYMWLFNDLLLYARQKSGGKYAYRGHIPLAGAAVTTLPESSSLVTRKKGMEGTPFKFQIIPPSDNRKYTLFFSTELVMREWMGSIILNIRDIDVSNSDTNSPNKLEAFSAASTSHGSREDDM